MKGKEIMVNATNIKNYLEVYTMEHIAFDWLNTVPKSPKAATEKYNIQRLIRGAINRTNSLMPKRTILRACQNIASDHAWCEKMLKEYSKIPMKDAIFDWNGRFTKEQAPMWGNYGSDNKISLEEAMGYMLFNRIKPYLIDNHKKMMFDRISK